MTTPTYTILYVNDPLASAAFYAPLLGAEPVEAQATFALFVSPAGLKLGLWAKNTVEPAAAGGPGAMELGFTVDTVAAVDALHADWKGRGVTIIQPPTDMDFGRTFTAVDPDGHRLRAFFCPM